MRKGRLAGIIVACTVVIIIAIVLAVIKPWEGTPSMETYTLHTIVSPSEAGSVSPSGGEYESGVQVSVTASPSSGYMFDHWSASASGTTPTVTITMNSDKTVTAHFKSTTQMYTLTVSINPSSAGSVSPSSGEYESGDQITLTASPTSGYTFDYWSGASSGTASTTTITMDSDKTVTANFDEEIEGISCYEARNHIGERTTVYGTVVSTNYASGSSGQPTFLNMCYAYPSPDRFTVVIWGENRGNFSQPPEDYYDGKTIYVSGLIFSYQGVPEIEVTSPSQILEE